jgi:hypothetical protein
VRSLTKTIPSSPVPLNKIARHPSLSPTEAVCQHVVQRHSKKICIYARPKGFLVSHRSEILLSLPIPRKAANPSANPSDRPSLFPESTRCRDTGDSQPSPAIFEFIGTSYHRGRSMIKRERDCVRVFERNCATAGLRNLSLCVRHWVIRW